MGAGSAGRQGRLSGLVAATVTPMDAGGMRADPGAMRELAAFLAERGVNGLFVAGTTGEGPLLDDTERLSMAQAALEGGGGRVAVVLQATLSTTQATLRLVREAGSRGIEAVAAVTPWFYPLGEAALEAFYDALAESGGDLAIYLYNIPQRTGNTLAPRLAERLARRHPQVAGIKDSSGDMESLLRFLEVAQRLRAGHEGSPEKRQTVGTREFAVFAGADHLALPFLRAGGSGIVSGTAGVAPEPFVALFRAVESGDQRLAERLFGVVRRVCELLGGGLRLDYYKAVLEARGLRAGRVRPPLAHGDPSELAAVVGQLREVYEAEGWPWR